jgi:hypothetical protein
MFPPPPRVWGIDNPEESELDGRAPAPPAQPASSGSARKTTLRVIGITMGVLLLLAIGIAAVVMVILKQQPAAKPRRRRSRYDDDDDY